MRTCWCQAVLLLAGCRLDRQARIRRRPHLLYSKLGVSQLPAVTNNDDESVYAVFLFVENGADFEQHTTKIIIVAVVVCSTYPFFATSVKALLDCRQCYVVCTTDLSELNGVAWTLHCNAPVEWCTL
jgi:hypothetical protein